MRTWTDEENPAADVEACVWRLALNSEGRRQPADAVWPQAVPPSVELDAVVDVGVDRQQLPRWVILDHGGPASGRHLPERPRSLVDGLVPMPERVHQGVRTTLPLSDDEWQRFVQQTAGAAEAVRAAAGVHILAIDDDGLLHAACSPLHGATNISRARVLDVVAACGPVGVCFVLEDLAPGGLSPTAGRTLLTAILDVADVTLVAIHPGTAFLPPLKHRRKGASVDVGGTHLASCVGLRQLVGARPLFGVGTSEADDEHLKKIADALEVDGVWRDVRPVDVR